ncbi:MAG: hypothetical protein ACXAC7_13690 [Candidatus Hodarchaeales archaeon]
MLFPKSSKIIKKIIKNHQKNHQVLVFIITPTDEDISENFEYIFKILCLALTHEIERPVWESLKISSLPQNVEIVPGVKFGIRGFKKFDPTIYIKVFFCSFNPQSLDPNVRRAYVHGTNGIVFTLTPKKLTYDNLYPIFYDIFETNAKSLPSFTVVLINDVNYIKTASNVLTQLMTTLSDELDLPELRTIPKSIVNLSEKDISDKILNEIIPSQLENILSDIEN